MNIPEEGWKACRRHAQFIDAPPPKHVVEDGVRTGKGPPLRNLPSKSWRVNCGWTVAANIAALPALPPMTSGTCRTPSRIHCVTCGMSVLVRHARRRILKISRNWRQDAFVTRWQRSCPAGTRMTSTTTPATRKDATPARSGAGADPHTQATHPACKRNDMSIENRHQHDQ
jgi:hypothetical protein